MPLRAAELRGCLDGERRVRPSCLSRPALQERLTLKAAPGGLVEGVI